MRSISQDSWQDRLDNLRISMNGRRVQRNGTAETAVVMAVRTVEGGFGYQLDDGRLVPTEEWTVIR